MRDEERKGGEQDRERKRGEAERAFSFLISLLDPFPLIPMTVCPAGSDSGSACACGQPQGADLAEIQSRSFYQPPEVDLTPLFLDSESS